MEEQPVALATTFYLGVPAHICAVGLYFRGGRHRFACHPPPKTKPRYASLGPKGSLSLTQNDGTVKQTLKYIEINELVKAGAFRRFKFTFVKGLVY